MSSPAPTVSVVLPAYNAQAHLVEAVDSILAQSFRDFELIAIDDGSSDDTGAILADFAARDARVVHLTNAPNQGLEHSLNRGLEAARGRYIARMDADDFAMPHRLALQAAWLDAHPEIVVLGGGFQRMNEDGAILGTVVEPLDPWAFEWVSYFRPPIMHPAAMFRASLIREHGLRYDPALATAEDFAMWGAMLEHGHGRNLSDIVLRYRVHASQISTAQRMRQRATGLTIAIERAIQHFPEIDARLVTAVMQHFRPAPESERPSLWDAAQGFRLMERSYAQRHGLNARQRRRLRAFTLRWYAMGVVRSGAARSPVTLVRSAAAGVRWWDVLAAESIGFVRRRMAGV